MRSQLYEFGILVGISFNSMNNREELRWEVGEKADNLNIKSGNPKAMIRNLIKFYINIKYGVTWIAVNFINEPYVCRRIARQRKVEKSYSVEKF